MDKDHRRGRDEEYIKNFISVLAILALVIAMMPGLAGDAFATWGSYGLSVGTYNKTKVKVTAAGNANYEASGAKAVTFTVKVKKWRES